MCFVKCWDLSWEKIISKDEIELLSWSKQLKDYRIRKLLKEWFIWESKYIAMKDSWKTDKEILEQLWIEAEKGGLKKEFDLLINSWKEKVENLLEL